MLERSTNHNYCSCGKLLGLRYGLCISCFFNATKKVQLTLTKEAMAKWPKTPYTRKDIFD